MVIQVVSSTWKWPETLVVFNLNDLHLISISIKRQVVSTISACSISNKILNFLINLKAVNLLPQLFALSLIYAFLVKMLLLLYFNFTDNFLHEK